MSRSSSTVDDAIEAVRDGRLVVILDSDAPDDGGMLVAAASTVTGRTVSFMAIHGSGLVGVAMAVERLRELDIPPMPARRGDGECNHLHTGADAHTGDESAASPEGRARTMRFLGDPTCAASDFQCPGHVFPLAVRDGGVLAEAQRPEAAFDLVALADAGSAAAVCRLVGRDGGVQGIAATVAFADHHGLAVISVQELVAYRLRDERIVTRAATARLPTALGEFRTFVYSDLGAGREHVAVVLGDVEEGRPQDRAVLLRLQPECFEADTLRSSRCDCGQRLRLALDAIGREGSGVLLYLRGPVSGAASLVANWPDVMSHHGHARPDTRALSAVPQILTDLCVPRVRLLTDGDRSVYECVQLGVRVVDQVTFSDAPEMRVRAA